MSYQTIKNYLSRMMKANGFFEAKKKFSFENEGENFDNYFIIENPKTELGEGSTLTTRFFPTRTFSIKIAKRISETGIQFDYDSLQAKLDAIVQDVHNPDNFRSDNIKRVQWQESEVSQSGTYFVANITFTCEDSITYV